MTAQNTNDRLCGALIGLAIGDAVGTTVEFMPRGSFAPVTDMTGGGPFELKAGQWTDDTSMALCLAASLAECQAFSSMDQMERYLNWFKKGYMSCTGSSFDIGMTVSAAIWRFGVTGNPKAGSTDPETAGNGSLMRLAPVPIFYFPDMGKAEFFAGESSKITHGTAECLDACRLFARMLCRAFAGGSKEEILLADAANFHGSSKIEAIARGEYTQKTENNIFGTGYVVACLEAALWCFHTTDSFEAAVLKAANLGDDADTTAAVCGQIAGAYYGQSGIPPRWIAKLAMLDTIQDLARQLIYHSPKD
jgi:ADP-ribosyl-[dinitrogen reductase] hydrolase